MSWVSLTIKSPCNVLWFNKADSRPTVAQLLAGLQFFWGRCSLLFPYNCSLGKIGLELKTTGLF